MMLFVLAAFSSYIVTCVVTSSSLFEPIREHIKTKTSKLKIGSSKHPIECRLCLGFWVSLACSIVYFSSIYYALPIYGLSYFLATQER